MARVRSRRVAADVRRNAGAVLRAAARGAAVTTSHRRFTATACHQGMLNHYITFLKITNIFKNFDIHKLLLFKRLISCPPVI